MILALITDDDATLATVNREAVSRGFGVKRFLTLQEAVAADVAVALVDWPAGRSAEDFIAGLRLAQSRSNAVPAVVLMPKSLRRMLPRALAAGAAGVLLTPVDTLELMAEIEEAVSRTPLLSAEKRAIFDELISKDLIGQSAAMRRCLLEIGRAAASEANVLLMGETGTGKEKCAHAIHLLSRRASFPYVTQDAASIPAALLESELFGSVKGAFTGADTNRDGRLTSVRNGSLLLDEIGDLDQPLQGKLLRVLESREFYPLGSDKVHQFLGRVIAATSVDLDKAVKEGRFRLDLLGRLDQFRIELPPLRDRREDIPLLAQRFIEKHALGRPLILSSGAMEILLSFEFPRNIRQLENAIVGAIARVHVGTMILPKHLPGEFLRDEASAVRPSSPEDLNNLANYEAAREEAVRKVDYAYLGALLERHLHNLTAAADAAGIDRKTFTSRWKNAQPQG